MDNIVHSLINRFTNWWIINQARFRHIHDALLQCLENSSPFSGREDYHPGEFCLQKTNTENTVIGSVRVIVNRNYIIIFPTNRAAEAITIMKSFEGKYSCIHGDTYNKTGKKIHVSISSVPHVLTEFIEAQYASNPWERKDITVSYLS